MFPLIPAIGNIFNCINLLLFLFSLKVYVLPPGKMEFFPSAVEAEIDTILSLPLAVATSLNDKGN